MKEAYYTISNIEQQARNFLDHVSHLRKNHNFTINASKGALLVIDMQRYFFEANSHAYIPSSLAIISRVQKLQNYFLQHSLRVYQTKHMNTEQNAGQMAKWWSNEILKADNPLVELIPEVINPCIQPIIKSQYDCFMGTGLVSQLHKAKIKQLFICGVMTHLCCETTARAAFTRGFEVFFMLDATATYTREFHLASLINLAHGFAIPLLAEELIWQLEQKLG